MPHIYLEYSSNITIEFNFNDLFRDMHQVINKITGIKIENCKSRATRLDTYFIADGDPANALVHLEVRIFEGRTPALKQETGRQLLTLLKRYFLEQNIMSGIQFTVDFQEIKKDLYFKYIPDSNHG